MTCRFISIAAIDVLALMLTSCYDFAPKGKPRSFKVEPDPHKTSWIINIVGDHPDGSLDFPIRFARR